LITGGTSGIGASIAHALAGAGARVAIVGRDRERVNAGVHRLRAEAGMQAAPIEGFIADLARVDDTLELAAADPRCFEYRLNALDALPE